MKRVFFLGAGATVADYPGAPLLKNLLGQMLDKDFRAHSDFQTEIKTFFSKYFFDLEDKSYWEYPSIQDVLSFIDTALLSEECLVGKNYLEHIRNIVVYLMGRSIENGTFIRGGNNTEDLVNQLTPGDTVISTNYDIIADNCFLKRFCNMNYGVRFRRNVDVWKEDQETRSATLAEPHVYSTDRSALLLKLHGSFNWVYCPRCNELDITATHKGAFHCMRNDVRCYNPYCTELYQALIVSPTFLKSYSNRIVREIWTLAEQTIAEAEEIIFIGYSMPVDDYEIKNMLLRGISKNKKRPCITVINKRPENLKEEMENARYEMNYRRVFGSVEYKACGFNRYFK